MRVLFLHSLIIYFSPTTWRMWQCRGVDGQEDIDITAYIFAELIKGHKTYHYETGKLRYYGKLYWQVYTVKNMMRLN